jgi:hypothetical protein
MSDDVTSNPAVEATTWTQTSAFPDLAPEVVGETAVGRSEEPAARPVPRTPGWVLVASGGHTAGFHRVKSVGARSEVRTVCGLKGRVVTDTASSIVECAACQAGGADLKRS